MALHRDCAQSSAHATREPHAIEPRPPSGLTTTIRRHIGLPLQHTTARTMGAGASLPASMQHIEANQGFIAVKEALGLSGEESANPLSYKKGDELVVLKSFTSMDSNNDGQLCLKEFLRNHKEHTDRKHPHEQFMYRFFGVVDGTCEEDAIIGVDPLVFFVCLHAFLVQDEESSVAFCFHMFDSNHDRVLEPKEFAALCRMAHPELDDAAIASKLNEIDSDKDFKLDLDEVLGKKHRETFKRYLWPVFRTADNLRQKIGGEDYWQRRKHALKRAKLMRPHFEKGDLLGLFHANLTVEDKKQLLGDKTEAEEWTRYDDPQTGYPYWCQNATGISTWEEPGKHGVYLVRVSSGAWAPPRQR